MVCRSLNKRELSVLVSALRLVSKEMHLDQSHLLQSTSGYSIGCRATPHKAMNYTIERKKQKSRKAEKNGCTANLQYVCPIYLYRYFLILSVLSHFVYIPKDISPNFCFVFVSMVSFTLTPCIYLCWCQE